MSASKIEVQELLRKASTLLIDAYVTVPDDCVEQITTALDLITVVRKQVDANPLDYFGEKQDEHVNP